MSEFDFDLNEALKYISPSDLSYQDWVNVGMALKEEGYSVTVWDNWSANDNRYHKGECEKKWESFNGSSSPVTGATIVQMAKDRGMMFGTGEDRELDWDDEISYEHHDEHVVVNKNWIEGKEINAPTDWQPHREIIRYLEALFEQSENVGYVVQSYEKDGKFIPANKGYYDRTAGQLIESLSQCDGDIGSVLGDYNTQAGAWIRFNPLDGKGVKNENVTEYRYALVESDNVDIEKQHAIICELELPVAVLVYSGKKSLHAIVKVDAANYDEYRKRVDFLYQICQKNGLSPDTQNRNPSRLSRLPGVQRGENRQYIVDTDIGKKGWDEWREWIESVNDDLPDTESMADAWSNLPELAPPLIDGILRQGHKMLIAGPSKAGKSYALIEMCCAIAEGKEWLGWNCTKGRVLYVNLELDRAKEVVVVSQTTFNYNKFQELVEIIKEKGYDIIVLNTICNATEERQTEARAIAEQVDAMIVIGGRNSSNTQKLFEICKNECKNTYYIQTVKDLDLAEVRSVDNVGITAGASTPNNIIEEVQKNVRNEL